MKRVFVVLAAVVWSGCATATAGEGDVVKPRADTAAEAEQQLRAVLSSLPKCEAGATVGRVTIAGTRCTRKSCGGNPCCNRCGWDASFTGMTGTPTPVEAGRVRELLKVVEGPLDCEVTAWEKVLATESLSLEQGCVVR